MSISKDISPPDITNTLGNKHPISQTLDCILDILVKLLFVCIGTGRLIATYSCSLEWWMYWSNIVCKNALNAGQLNLFFGIEKRLTYYFIVLSI